MDVEQNEQKNHKCKMSLKTIFATELFSKLQERDQDAIIAQIEALLSRG